MLTWVLRWLAEALFTLSFASGWHRTYVTSTRKELTFEDLYDAFGCVAIPEIRLLPLFLMTGQYIFRRCQYFFWILTNYAVGSFRDRYWPLCIFSQRQTRHPQDSAFLLNSS